MLATGLAFAPLRRFYDATPRGALTLPAWLGVPYGAVVLAVVAIALVGFRVTERIEVRPRGRRRGGAGWRAAALAGALAPLVGSPYRPAAPGAVPGSIDVRELARVVADQEDHVSAVQLAAWIRARRPRLRVIDVRSAPEFHAYHIPGPEHVPLEDLATARFAADETS